MFIEIWYRKYNSIHHAKRDASGRHRREVLESVEIWEPSKPILPFLFKVNQACATKTSQSNHCAGSVMSAGILLKTVTHWFAVSRLDASNATPTLLFSPSPPLPPCHFWHFGLVSALAPVWAKTGERPPQYWTICSSRICQNSANDHRSWHSHFSENGLYHLHCRKCILWSSPCYLVWDSH